jgi:hypothetical protein
VPEGRGHTAPILGRLLRWTIPVVLVLLPTPGPPPTCATVEDQQLSEEMVKAVFLERFTRFVTWPKPSGMEDGSQPFVLGVIGEDPFGGLLEEVYREGQVLIRGKKVDLRKLKLPQEAALCHMVFIGKTDRETLARLLAVLRAKPVLTVSDHESYGQLGVHINFFMEGDKRVRFEINERRARTSSLHISYQLLQVARIVMSPDD